MRKKIAELPWELGVSIGGSLLPNRAKNGFSIRWFALVWIEQHDFAEWHGGFSSIVCESDWDGCIQNARCFEHATVLSGSGIFDAGVAGDISADAHDKELLCRLMLSVGRFSFHLEMVEYR